MIEKYSVITSKFAEDVIDSLRKTVNLPSVRSNPDERYGLI